MIYDKGYFTDRSIVTHHGCWEWSLSRDKHGYGRVNVKCGSRSRTWQAHRLSYCANNSLLISTKTLVCHSCDNPPCVNPDHLFASSHSGNMIDMYTKGRGNRPAGTAHWRTRLSHSDIETMKGLRAAGWLLRDIAELYGLTRSGVGHIINGRTWKND